VLRGITGMIAPAHAATGGRQLIRRADPATFSPQMGIDSIPVRLSKRAVEFRALAHGERDDDSRRQFLKLAADFELLAKRATTVEFPPEADGTE
jgi:hypothetical protein